MLDLMSGREGSIDGAGREAARRGKGTSTRTGGRQCAVGTLRGQHADLATSRIFFDATVSIS